MPRPARPIITYRLLFRATHAVCRALGEAPLRMLEGAPCDAQAYVAEVLTRAFPDTPIAVIVRWCGSRNVHGDAARMAALMSGDSWREVVVSVGLAAIGRADLIRLDDAAFALAAPEAADPQPWRAPPLVYGRPPDPAPDDEPISTPAVVAARAARTVVVPAGRPHPMRRVVDHRVYGVVAMGEPPPGRSALDQRRSEQRLEIRL